MSKTLQGHRTKLDKTKKTKGTKAPTVGSRMQTTVMLCRQSRSPNPAQLYEILQLAVVYRLIARHHAALHVCADNLKQPIWPHHSMVCRHDQ